MTLPNRKSAHPDTAVLRESARIAEEYARREREIGSERYAPWRPDVALTLEERSREAARMLACAGCFPNPNSACFEVGYGKIGWLGQLISWGAPASKLCGLELDAARAGIAQAALPIADLRVGDATEIPWPDEAFHLVICSTVMTSILDRDVRRRVAREIERVLAPGGALLWYDFAYDNPRNRQVSGIRRRELRALFPALEGEIRSVTLAPPVARAVAPLSHFLASALALLPFLRTHLLAVLVKSKI